MGKRVGFGQGCAPALCCLGTRWSEPCITHPAIWLARWAAAWFGILALAALAWPSLARAAGSQRDFDESGWRAATEPEKALRKAFEDGRGTWSKSDGEEALYDCLYAWALWSTAAREPNDAFPTIHGELSHAYAEGQLSHYLNRIYRLDGNNPEAIGRKIVATVQRTEPIFTQGNDKALFRFMGKCYVQPASWDLQSGVTVTGPQFMRGVLQQNVPDSFPSHVKDQAARQRFDQLVLAKDFAAAANFAADLHGTGRKSTVCWHEVLAAAELAIADGDALELSTPLLATLSKVWWPKWKRNWALVLIQQKNGTFRGGGTDGSRFTFNEKLLEEPAWAKIERERYLGGRTIYTPCNMWNRMGC